MIQFEQESIDEEFERGFEALNDFIDINGLLDLRDLIMTFKSSERCEFLGATFKEDLSKECLNNSKKIDLINYAKKELGSFKFLITKSNLSFTSFIGLCSVIVFSCGCDFKRELSSDEIFKILNSDLISKLTLGLLRLDNFEDILNLYQDLEDNNEKCSDINNLTQNHTKELNQEFFKKLSSVKWDKRAKKLHNTIKEGCWFGVQLQHLIEPGPYAQFGFAARYLASCNVLVNNRDEVLAEDIVNAWFLTFKLFQEDLRPYIFKNEDIFKENSNETF